MEPEDDYQNGDDQEEMRPMRKVGRMNLIILLIYSGAILVFSVLFASGDELSMMYVWGGIAMLVHGAANLVVGVLYFIMRKSEYGKGALLSALVLLVIGFSSCVLALTTMSFH